LTMFLMVGFGGDLMNKLDELKAQVAELQEPEPEVKTGDWCFVRDDDDDPWGVVCKIGEIKPYRNHPFQEVVNGIWWKYAKPVVPELQTALDKELGK
jgi:hypothetical protein